MKKIGILAMVLAGAMALSACGAKNETEVEKNNSEKNNKTYMGGRNDYAFQFEIRELRSGWR